MGETTPTSWKAGLCLLAFLVVILLCGWQFGGGSDKPTHVRLSCTTYDGTNYTCQNQ